MPPGPGGNSLEIIRILMTQGRETEANTRIGGVDGLGSAAGSNIGICGNRFFISLAVAILERSCHKECGSSSPLTITLANRLALLPRRLKVPRTLCHNIS